MNNAQPHLLHLESVFKACEFPTTWDCLLHPSHCLCKNTQQQKEEVEEDRMSLSGANEYEWSLLNSIHGSPVSLSPSPFMWQSRCPHILAFAISSFLRRCTRLYPMRVSIAVASMWNLRFSHKDSLYFSRLYPSLLLCGFFLILSGRHRLSLFCTTSCFTEHSRYFLPYRDLNFHTRYRYTGRTWSSEFDRLVIGQIVTLLGLSTHTYKMGILTPTSQSNKQIMKINWC